MVVSKGVILELGLNVRSDTTIRVALNDSSSVWIVL